MREFTTNRFYKGINTDLSLLERQADVLLDALNVRLTSKETDGLFAANIKGNIEEFQLSTDFLPIGAVEFNGILFVFSVNSTSGEGEIGTFPSPNGTSQGFTRTYSPLQNFTLDNPNLYVDPCEGEPQTITRQDFTTDLLKFSCEHQIRVVARLDFDKSINLYWTDNFNPIRSINTGFHSETGEFNDRYVSQDMISKGIINVISENEFIPIVKLSEPLNITDPLPVGNQGKLKAGNYFVFVRYTDIAFNSSSFLGVSSAIPIFHQKQLLYDPTTTEEDVYGLEAFEETNRDINLVVSGLDTSEAFIEVAYIYYYGENEFEIKLIDLRFDIGGNSSIRVNVSGFETTLDLSLDELIAYKPTSALYAKDIAQIDSRLYIANTRGIQLDHPDLREFFCSIEINEAYNIGPKVVHVNNLGAQLRDNAYAADPLDVNKRTGYFSGEIYVFAAVPILKGGFTGPAFPMTGFDNISGTPLNKNVEGVFRFSSAKSNPFHDADDSYIKGVSFDMSAAAVVYENSDFLKENMVGVQFTRGERIKNILYQGILCRTYTTNAPDPIDLLSGPLQFWNATGIGQPPGPPPNSILTSQFEKRRWIPLIEAAIPYWMQTWFFKPPPYIPATDEFVAAQTLYYDLRNAGDFDNTAAYGIFSTDYYLDKGQGSTGVGRKSFIDPIGSTLDYMQPRLPIDANTAGTVTNGFPSGDIYYNTDTDFYNFTDKYGWYAPTHNVNAWDADGVTLKDNNIFVSKIGEGKEGAENETSSGFSFNQWDRLFPSENNDEHLVSLPISTPDYVLVERVESESVAITKYLQIVNVCRTNPEELEYASIYDFKNTLFSPISEFLPTKNKSDVLSISSKEFHQGDCFVARNYLKILNGFNDEIGDRLISIIGLSDFDQRGASLPKYGMAVGIVTENAYNPNYRVKKGRNEFYPTAGVPWVGEEMNNPESNFYNTGYQRMLSPRQFLGIDKLKPFSDNSFPTRIWPSFKHILNSLKDGYLQFSDSKDFDYQYGPINALISHNDQLFSFQNDAINLHPINERSVSNSDSTDTPFILGESRGLTEFKRALSTEYGTQHQWSIITGERGIYGVDWNKQCVWRVGANGFENLGIQKGCEKWIEDIINLSSSGVSDITELLPDNPVCNLGVHSIFDREYKEVLMTFILGDGNNKTISYSEKGDFFNTKYSFTPIFYAELEKDLYSFSGNSFWRHDANLLYDNFYGQQHPAFIEFVVNPKGEIAKHFDNLIINSNNREFSKIEFNTQHQQALQDPFLGEFFSRAIYREFQWKLPIRRADSITDPQLSLAVVQSRMRGRYLIINLEYAGDQDMWVREVITAYTQSKG